MFCKSKGGKIIPALVLLLKAVYTYHTRWLGCIPQKRRQLCAGTDFLYWKVRLNLPYCIFPYSFYLTSSKRYAVANIYVQSTASALLCFCVLFSNSSKTALKKWSCSIPFTLIFYFVLAATNFDVRLINRLLPGYGHLSAGAGFAFIIEFGLFTIAQGIANLLAIACSNPLNAGGLQKMCSIIQIVILPIVCIIIVFAVLYLELTMPTWKEIYYSVYG